MNTTPTTPPPTTPPTEDAEAFKADYLARKYGLSPSYGVRDGQYSLAPGYEVKQPKSPGLVSSLFNAVGTAALWFWVVFLGWTLIVLPFISAWTLLAYPILVPAYFAFIAGVIWVSTEKKPTR